MQNKLLSGTVKHQHLGTLKLQDKLLSDMAKDPDQGTLKLLRTIQDKHQHLGTLKLQDKLLSDMAKRQQLLTLQDKIIFRTMKSLGQTKIFSFIGAQKFPLVLSNNPNLPTAENADDNTSDRKEEGNLNCTCGCHRQILIFELADPLFSIKKLRTYYQFLS